MDAERAYVGGGCVALLTCAVVLGGVAVLAVPSLIQPRKRRLDSIAVGNLKWLVSTQTHFREGDKERDGVLDYGTLRELSDATLVDSVLGAGVKLGYRYEVRVSPEAPEYLWMAVANPVDRSSGLRSFATNHAGVIHYAPGRLGCNDACQIPPSCRPVGK